METALSVNIPVYEHQQLSINAFGHSVTMPGHTYGPAVRPYYLIHFILEGKGEFIVNGTHYKLSAGKGFLIEPDYKTPGPISGSDFQAKTPGRQWLCWAFPRNSLFSKARKKRP